MSDYCTEARAHGTNTYKRTDAIETIMGCGLSPEADGGRASSGFVGLGKVISPGPLEPSHSWLAQSA